MTALHRVPDQGDQVILQVKTTKQLPSAFFKLRSRTSKAGTVNLGFFYHQLMTIQTNDKILFLTSVSSQ